MLNFTLQSLLFQTLLPNWNNNSVYNQHPIGAIDGRCECRCSGQGKFAKWRADATARIEPRSAYFPIAQSFWTQRYGLIGGDVDQRVAAVIGAGGADVVGIQPAVREQHGGVGDAAEVGT